MDMNANGTTKETTMNARRLANKLRTMGVPIPLQGVKEGTEMEDGEIHVAQGIHIQVPTYAYGKNHPCVVRVGDGGVLTFYPPRKTPGELISDLEWLGVWKTGAIR